MSKMVQVEDRGREHTLCPRDFLFVYCTQYCTTHLPSRSVLSPALSHAQRRLVGAVANTNSLRDEDTEFEVTSCSAVLIKAALCDTLCAYVATISRG
jgi:hypothetical protein